VGATATCRARPGALEDAAGGPSATPAEEFPGIGGRRGARVSAAPGAAAGTAADPGGAAAPADGLPIAPSHEPIVFPRSGAGLAPDAEDVRATRALPADDSGWSEKWELASRYAQGGFDDEANEVIDAALAASPPEAWASRLLGLRHSIRLRQAEEVLRVDARGVRDYVPFGSDVEWVLRLRNVSSQEIVIAPPGSATAPDGTPISPAALALTVVRRDVDIYTSELRRSWTQPVAVQPPGVGEVRIPPGRTHEVRARIPASDAGGALSGLRVLEVDGVLRPSGLTIGGRSVGEPLRIRKGRVVALPDGFEPLAADPLGSMERAVQTVMPRHLLVAAEFVPARDRVRAMEVLAGALGEGDRALRAAALSAVALIRERAVGTPLAPLCAPFVGALARHPERQDDLFDALRTLSGRALAPDARLWTDWWRREQAAGTPVAADAAEGGVR
jgi:hypothetical protein